MVGRREGGLELEYNTINIKYSIRVKRKKKKRKEVMEGIK